MKRDSHRTPNRREKITINETVLHIIISSIFSFKVVILTALPISVGKPDLIEHPWDQSVTEPSNPIYIL